MMNVVLFISYFILGFLAISTLVLIFFWKDYYFIYNHRLLFVIGLEFSRYLTDYAAISVLIWYFTYYRDDLVMSAILTNIQASLSSLLVIFMAHAANSYVGRFHTLLFSNTTYICGLMLLWLFNPYDVKWLVVIALVLLSIGTSGANILQDVLKDLVNDIDKSEDQNSVRSLARAAIWSRIAYVSGVMSAILWVANDAVGGVHPSWPSTFFICLITMTTTSIIFCAGHNIYHQGELTERPAMVFFRVFCVHIKKLTACSPWRFLKHAREDRSPKNMETKKTENEEILQGRPTQALDAEGKNVIGRSYNQEDMVVVKSLLRMFPMWGMFFVVSIISATGFTFFLQQYKNLHLSDKIPLQIYNIVQDFSRFAIPFLYRWICGLRKNEKVKIGVGMLCGIISCIFAWQLEVHRLKEVDHLIDKEYSNTSISFLWLVPQFCVLGCMEGLTREGLLKFYKSQMKEEPLISYGEEYIETVMGLGKLFNIFLILVVNSQSGWFGDTINDSQLDKYYLVLVYVCAANFILYCCIARYYYTDQDLANGDQNQGNQVLDDDDKKDGNQILANGDQNQGNQVLADDDKKDGNQILANGDQNQGNQVLADDDQKDGNQILANGDQSQGNQVLADDDQKDGNQILANGDQNQGNQVLANDDNRY